MSSEKKVPNQQKGGSVTSDDSASGSASSNNKDSDSITDLAKSIKKFEETLNPVKSDKRENFDDKIKKILQKDLATDSDLETSLNYSQEENENKYQEIFSNSNVTPKKDVKNDSKNMKDKKKFFNLYSQF